MDITVAILAALALVPRPQEIREILATVSSTRGNAAVRGIEPYFNSERGMYRMVGDKGDDEWVPDAENGPHVRITEKLSKAEVGRVIDELMTRRPKNRRPPTGA